MEKLALKLPGFGGITPPPFVPTGGLFIKGQNAIRVGLSFFLIIILLLAFLYGFIGAIRYIFSRGDKQKVQAAREKITYSVVGLIVAFLAFVLMGIFSRFVGVNLISKTGIISVSTDCKDAGGQCDLSCTGLETGVFKSQCTGDTICCIPLPTPTPKPACSTITTCTGCITRLDCNWAKGSSLFPAFCQDLSAKCPAGYTEWYYADCNKNECVLPTSTPIPTVAAPTSTPAPTGPPVPTLIPTSTPIPISTPTPAPTPPTALITIESIDGLFVDYSGTSSFATGTKTITAWAWDFDNNGITDLSGTSNPDPHLYPSAGTYTVKLTVTDSEGLTDDGLLTVTVSPPPTPTIPPNPPDLVIYDQVIPFDYTPKPAAPGDPIVFTFEVANIGAGDAPATAVRLYERNSEPTCTDQAGLLPGEVPIAPLASSSKDPNKTFTIGGFANPGIYTVWAFVDPTCKIGESNDGNNTKSILVTVQ